MFVWLELVQKAAQMECVLKEEIMEIGNCRELSKASPNENINVKEKNNLMPG